MDWFKMETGNGCGKKDETMAINLNGKNEKNHAFFDKNYIQTMQDDTNLSK